MTQFQSGSNTTKNYLYRPDGMRIQKSTSSSVYTTYGYDGQMQVEEFNYEFIYPSNQFIKVIRYGLGARGVDRIERVQADNTALVGYPIYDAHGNMVATISKNGNSYILGDQRGYDAWGVIRSGNTSGEPRGTHCANLGHVQDDESGFVYMRARYYEPGTGRFASQDPQMQGWNWFEYCGNDPVSNVDAKGRSSLHDLAGMFLIAMGCLLMLMAVASGPNAVEEIQTGWANLKAAAAMFKTGLTLNIAVMRAFGQGTYIGCIITAFQATVQILNETMGAIASIGGLACRALLGLAGFAIMCWGVWLWQFD